MRSSVVLPQPLGPDHGDETAAADLQAEIVERQQIFAARALVAFANFDELKLRHDRRTRPE